MHFSMVSEHSRHIVEGLKYLGAEHSKYLGAEHSSGWATFSIISADSN